MWRADEGKKHVHYFICSACVRHICMHAVDRWNRFNFCTQTRWPGPHDVSTKIRANRFSRDFIVLISVVLCSLWTFCLLWFRQNRSLTLNFIKFIQTHRSPRMLTAQTRKMTHKAMMPPRNYRRAAVSCFSFFSGSNLIYANLPRHPWRIGKDTRKSGW